MHIYKRWKGRGHLIYNVASNFFKKTFLTFWDFHKPDEKFKFPPKIWFLSLSPPILHEL